MSFPNIFHQRRFPMKPNRFLLIAALAAGLATVSMAFRVQTGTSSMTVVEHADTDTVTDTGNQGDSAGDILTFANPVFDENNEKQVGADNGYCFRTEIGKAWECAWTLTLQDGSLTVEGPFYAAAEPQLAVHDG